MQRLRNAFVGATCGACKGGIMCEKSISDTLRANGVPDTEENKARLRGLKYENRNMVWGYQFRYSEVGEELYKIIKEQHV